MLLRRVNNKQVNNKLLKSGYIPLVSSDDTVQGIPFIQNLSLGHHCTAIKIERWHAGLFAMPVEDYALAPRFYPGYLAIIDTTRLPADEDYVLVYFPELQQSLLRRLEITNGEQFLITHDPEYATINLSAKKPEEYIIQGVVINTLMTQTCDKAILQ